MKKGTESLVKEIIAENSLNLGKELDKQVQEASRTLNHLNSKRLSPRYTILKLSKGSDNERILKATRGRWGKRATTNETPSGFSQISQQKLYKTESGMIYSKYSDKNH